MSNHLVRRTATAMAVSACAALTAAAPAAAEPPLDALGNFCFAHGATFFGHSSDFEYAGCDASGVYTEAQLTAASNICTQAYGGTFVNSPPSGERLTTTWYCVFPR